MFSTELSRATIIQIVAQNCKFLTTNSLWESTKATKERGKR